MSGAKEKFDFITFLTDYGLADEFVGVCHGVISTLAPHVRIIDICHEVRPYDTRSGALMLVRAIQYMPPAVHLAVVDPGVGTERKAIAVETDSAYFVGPDNGLLSPAVQMMGGGLRAVEIASPDIVLPRRGGLTFAGRDIFAPAAAALANGTPLEALGPEIPLDSLVPMMVPLPQQGRERIDGEVLWVDRFGNCETNVSPEDMDALGIELGERVKITIGGATYEARWVRAFGDVSPGEVIVIEDHYGLLAVSVNQGNASEQLGLKEGMAVSLLVEREGESGE